MSTATASNQSGARRAHRRALGWSLVAILVGAIIGPLGGYLYVAQAQDELAWQQNPRAETWRGVRQGNEGYTSASGPFTTNSLIHNGGENWRNLRNGPVAGLTPWLVAVVLLAIGLYHILSGRNRVEEPLSGNRVQRWTGWERGLHWFTAITFIAMAITGVSLLFGRAVLIPLLGAEGFAAWAAVAKGTHNLLGPLFTVGVLLILVSWMKYNIPSRTDVEWFKKGGGLFGGHASAGRMNGGEKAWFWFIATAGVVVCATGLILDFPNFQQSRTVMQASSLIHAVVSMGWIALALGHVYIGTLGTEGALEGMTTGYVSEEWARQHHDLWLDEVKGQGGAVPEEQPPPTGGPAHGPAQRHPD